MSTRPHIVLSRTLRHPGLPLVDLRCAGCLSGLAGSGDGKFRVHAKGKLLDIGLLVAGVSRDRTSKINVHCLVPVRYLDPTLSAGCSGESFALVARVLLDPLLAQHNRCALERDSCWELVAPSPSESTWPAQAPVIFDESVPLRPARLTAHGAGHQPRGGRSLRQDRRPVEPQNPRGIPVRPATSLRRGPQPGGEARWPRPGLHRAAVRTRMLMAGRNRGSGSVRYRRRR